MIAAGKVSVVISWILMWSLVPRMLFSILLNCRGSWAKRNHEGAARGFYRAARSTVEGVSLGIGAAFGLSVDFSLDLPGLCLLLL